MIRLGIYLVVAGLLRTFSTAVVFGADSGSEALEFKEIYDLIRAHAPEVNQAELDRAAANALVSALAPKVVLVGSEAGPTEPGPALLKVNLFDGDILYFRVSQVAEGLAQSLRKNYVAAAGTNKLKGVALDLRFASGEDYAAAARAADVFISKERPLLNWASESARSKEKSDAITLPVAVLVNHQ